MYDELKKVIYCSKHQLDYSKENYKKAMELELALGLGCLVIVKGIREDNPYCERDVVIDNRRKGEKIRLGYYGDVPTTEIEILGKPLILKDIFMAISRHVRPLPKIELFSTETEISTDRDQRNNCLWSNLHDSLDWHKNNRPETVQFLIDILINK